MARTPWPWESEAEAVEKAAALTDASTEGRRRMVARLSSPLAEFREMDAAFRETDDKSFAVKRELSIRKGNMRAFTKARELISGRLSDDRSRRLGLMRKLKMQPFKPEELNNGSA